jgi:hypothetical protein
MSLKSTPNVDGLARRIILAEHELLGSGGGRILLIRATHHDL